MERRTFLAMLPASLLAASHAAEAQQGKHVIGVLNLGFADSQRSGWDAFRQGLRDLGYVEDGTLRFQAAAPTADAVNQLLMALQRDGWQVTVPPQLAPDPTGATVAAITVRAP